MIVARIVDTHPGFRWKRTLQQAFPSDYPTNCYGIAEPIPTRPPLLLDRIKRLFGRR